MNLGDCAFMQVISFDISTAVTLTLEFLGTSILLPHSDYGNSRHDVLGYDDASIGFYPFGV